MSVGSQRPVEEMLPVPFRRLGRPGVQPSWVTDKDLGEASVLPLQWDQEAGQLGRSFFFFFSFFSKGYTNFVKNLLYCNNKNKAHPPN